MTIDLTEVQELAVMGYWLTLKSPFKPGELWWAGFTPHDCSPWNGRPDFYRSGVTAQEAIHRAAEDVKQLQGRGK